MSSQYTEKNKTTLIEINYMDKISKQEIVLFQQGVHINGNLLPSTLVFSNGLK